MIINKNNKFHYDKKFNFNFLIQQNKDLKNQIKIKIN